MREDKMKVLWTRIGMFEKGDDLGLSLRAVQIESHWQVEIEN